MTIDLRVGAGFLNRDERAAYARGLVLLASGDDHLDARERRVLREVARRLQVRLPRDPQRFDPVEVAGALGTQSLREAFVHDALQLRGEGGTWDLESLETLKFFCDRWRLSYPALGVDWGAVRSFEERWWEARHKASLAEAKRQARRAIDPTRTSWFGVACVGLSCLWTVPVFGPTVLRRSYDQAQMAWVLGFALPLAFAIWLRARMSPGQVVAAMLVSGALVLGLAGFVAAQGRPIDGLQQTLYVYPLICFAALQVMEDYA